MYIRFLSMHPSTNQYVPHAVTHHTKETPIQTKTTNKDTDNLYVKCFNI